MDNKDKLKAKRKFTMWEDWRGYSTEDYAVKKSKKSMNRYTRRTTKNNLKNISKYF